jgi:hypothetical protein
VRCRSRGAEEEEEEEEEEEHTRITHTIEVHKDNTHS